jgi:hypothetical protein
MTIFTQMGEKKVLDKIGFINSAARRAVVYAVQLEKGTDTSRLVLYCYKDDVQLLLSTIPDLQAQRVSAVPFKQQPRKGQQNQQSSHGASDKSRQSQAGLTKALDRAFKTGECKYKAQKMQCPFQGRCRFSCY